MSWSQIMAHDMSLAMGTTPSGKFLNIYSIIKETKNKTSDFD